MEWVYSSSLFIYICLSKLLFAVAASCPGCPTGSGQGICKHPLCPTNNYYNGRKCLSCTTPCSVAKMLVQVEDCGNCTNRLCHCPKGYYCPEPQSFTCLLKCRPCHSGTFSPETSLATSCRPHTDCESQGLVKGTKGSNFQDNVCVAPLMTPLPKVVLRPARTPHFPPTTEDSSGTTVTHQPPARTTQGPPKADSSVTQHSTKSTVDLSSAAQPSFSPVNVSSSVPPALLTTEQSSLDSRRDITTSPPSRGSTLHPKYLATHNIEGFPTGQELDPAHHQNFLDSQNHLWLVVLLLFLAVLAYCLWLKGKALRKRRRCTECLPLGKYQVAKKAGYNVYVPQQQPDTTATTFDTGNNTHVEWQIPVSRDSDGLQREAGPATQGHPGQGSMQHVTMDKSGKGESISNTVGSIFIYSPGMVVLGTNASERREDGRQEGDEQQHVASVPQQESLSSFSSSNNDSVGLSTQEEAIDKELSYPIPASGK